MSAWGTIPCCQSAKTAEAIAVREGMKSIIPMATNPVIVESDNSTVVNELKSAMTSRSQFFVILSESRDLLIHLPDYKVQKVNGTSNIVAHELASFGRSVWSGGVLLSATPPCVLDSAQKDCNDSCKHNSQV
jgi:hypothetical protein